SRATATAHVRDLDLLDDLFRGHVMERLDPGGVSAVGDVFLDRIRVNEPALPHQDPSLTAEIGIVKQRRDVAVGLVVEDANGLVRVDLAATEAGKKGRNVIRAYVPVQDHGMPGTDDGEVWFRPAPATAAYLTK